MHKQITKYNVRVPPHDVLVEELVGLEALGAIEAPYVLSQFSLMY